SYAGSLGAMMRPRSWLQIGANVRTPVTVSADGTVTATAPAATPSATIAPASASLETKLPWVVRGGVRLLLVEGKFERGDLEADFTWENWNAAQGEGPRVRIPRLGIFENVDASLLHRYGDTYSIRGGGAVNTRGGVTVRAGAYYDAAATADRFTRLDFD